MTSMRDTYYRSMYSNRFFRVEKNPGRKMIAWGTKKFIELIRPDGSIRVLVGNAIVFSNSPFVVTNFNLANVRGASSSR